MIREVDLVSYLPPFIAEYKEIDLTLTAENPEFDIIWDAANRVLYNHFIVTADEYGISRYEKMLGIYPQSTEDLEMRRMRVLNRWFNATPYTIRMLVVKMIEVLGGEQNFSVWTDFEMSYKLNLILYTTDEIRFNRSQMEEVKYLLAVMVPANIYYKINDKINMGMYHRTIEQVRLKNVRFRMSIPFLPARTYDGTFHYDGSARYDAKRNYKIGVGMKIYCRTEGPREEIGNLAVETRRNVQYYNGEKKYDGITKYNAMIRKDVIE